MQSPLPNMEQFLEVESGCLCSPLELPPFCMYAFLSEHSLCCHLIHFLIHKIQVNFVVVPAGHVNPVQDFHLCCLTDHSEQVPTKTCFVLQLVHPKETSFQITQGFINQDELVRNCIEKQTRSQLMLPGWQAVYVNVLQL